MTIKDLAQLAMDVADALIEVREERDALESGLQALASRFEELAGQHRIALGSLRGQDLLIPPSPGPGWYWVKGHWRSRNQAVGEPDHPTVQPDPATGQPEASEGRPEGIWPGWTEATSATWWVGDHLGGWAQRPAEPTGLAVCEWDCERWAISEARKGEGC